MYGKLAVKNIRRSLRDYIIYFVTLTLTAALMYSFLALGFSPDILTMAENMSILTSGILILSVLVALLSSLVVGYAVRFMLGQRKKEFAAYELMGMEVKTVRNLFLVENGIIELPHYVRTVQKRGLVGNGLEHPAYVDPSLPILRLEHHLEDYPSGRIPSHWHPEFLFVLILRGRAAYIYHQDSEHPIEYELEEGDGAFINSRVVHGCRQLAPGTRVFVFGMLPSVMATPLLGTLYQKKILLLINSRIMGVKLSGQREEDRPLLELFQSYYGITPGDEDMSCAARPSCARSGPPCSTRWRTPAASGCTRTLTRYPPNWCAL